MIQDIRRAQFLRNFLQQAETQPLGRYDVFGVIGQGATGAVLKAYDNELDRWTAIKVLHSTTDEFQTKRLRREAQAMASLSHPNIVQVYEIGRHNNSNFVAMEMIDGQTIKDWISQYPRPTWKECAEVFIQLGKGLSAAHTKGIIHRDFKPDNAMIDKEGRARILDFGLARNSTPENHATTIPRNCESLSSQYSTTRAGSIIGTPAYMSPEQLKGLSADARSDQFSFCVALYESLYDRRPFTGNTIQSRIDSITSEQVDYSAPTGKKVPPALVRALRQGLRADPAHRWDSMLSLIRELSKIVSPTRRAIRRSAATLALTGIIAGIAMQYAKLEQDYLIFDMTTKAHQSYKAAKESMSNSEKDRRSAFSYFDSGNAETAQELWTRAHSKAESAKSSLTNASQELEAAIAIDPSRDDVRSLLSSILIDRAKIAELWLDRESASNLARRAMVYDKDTAREWYLRVPVSITTTPSGASIEFHDHNDLIHTRDCLYATDYPYAKECLKMKEPRPLGPAPLSAIELPPGSYTFIAKIQHRRPVKLPVLVTRDKPLSISVEIPPDDTIPPGFIYVPGGDTLVGTGDGRFSEVFYNAAPIHEVNIPSFFIGRHETTYAQWIEFLENHPEHHQPAMSPRIDQGFMPLRLFTTHDKEWKLRINICGESTEVGFKQPILCHRRSKRREIDWLDMPATAISFPLGQKYIDWLDRSGKVPGARFCSGHEWERAGRGADGRLYPHGSDLDPDDANVDITYGKNSDTWGPDEVGSHPDSRSVFGVEDLSGNAGEWTMEKSWSHELQPALRGGAFMMDALSAGLSGRQLVPPDFVDGSVGLRVCAPYPLPRALGEPRLDHDGALTE